MPNNPTPPTGDGTWRSAARLLACVCVALVAAAGSHAPTAAQAPPLIDYSQMDNWVCHPGVKDRCDSDLSTAVIEAGGLARIEPFRRASSPDIDCFYVPTVSETAGANLDPRVSDAEQRSVRQQAERFASVCRLYVPYYRPTSAAGAAPPPAGRSLPTDGANVIAAWDHYMAHENRGRGVVLIGHSKGAGLLMGVLRARVDGMPAQRQLVSVIVPGSIVMTPVGKEVGGTFKAIPPCRNDTQTGCVIVFNAMRADRLPAPEGLRRVAGQEQVCTNPAALSGGTAMLKPYLSSTGESILPEVTAPQAPWTQHPLTITTPFVTLPSYYSAECLSDAQGAFLAITRTPTEGDQRTGALAGDWMSDGKPDPTMGLHLIDFNLAAGNLVDIVRRQAAAYTAAREAAR